MNREALWEDLARYFSGELGAEEKEQLETWIKEDPEREKKVQALYVIWEESGSLPYQLDVEKSWNTLSWNMDRLDRESRAAFQNNLGNELQVNRHKLYTQLHHFKKRRRVGSVTRQVVMAAVAATVLLTAGLFTFNNYSAEIGESLGSREFVARNGEQLNFKLNDGSNVILHAGSRLEIPLQFNEKDRELFLEGEAYFEVAHNAAKPFTVHSESSQIRVLGTKFLVQAWSDTRNQVEVVVADGKVAFGSDRESDTSDGTEVILTRNQRGILANNKVTVLDNADMDWYMGWTRGTLIFNDRQLREIIPKLERWYDVEIKTKDEQISAHTLTAEIDYKQPMGEVLEGIAIALDLDLEKTDRTFTFETKPVEEQ